MQTTLAESASNSIHRRPPAAPARATASFRARRCASSAPLVRVFLVGRSHAKRRGDLQASETDDRGSTRAAFPGPRSCWQPPPGAEPYASDLAGAATTPRCTAARAPPRVEIDFTRTQRRPQQLATGRPRHVLVYQRPLCRIFRPVSRRVGGVFRRVAVGRGRGLPLEGRSIGA